MWPKNLQVETPPSLVVQTFQSININVPILILPPSVVKYNSQTRTIKINNNDNHK